MKKKIVMAMLVGCIITGTLTGCSNKGLEDIVRNAVDTVFGEEESSDKEDEKDEDDKDDESLSDLDTQSQESDTSTQNQEETTATLEDETQSEEENEDRQDSNLSEIEKLTPGELEARRTQQANFKEARDTVYMIPNSKDKTVRINQMDRQILANNAYDFSKKNIVFIGDSITEGILGSVNDSGAYVSYPDYVESYLHFNRYLNHGKGGRMFSDYGSDEYSLNADFGNVTNIDSDIIVVFAGVNDYLSSSEQKAFGDVNSTQSSSGYCGAVRYFMKQLQTYYGDRDIFFVMNYNIDKQANCTYSDITYEPTLNDYLEVQRKLCKEFGFNVIDLYNDGFMDCTDEETADYYLADGLHPNDNGNIVLGEHIAAELSLYYSQN